MTILLSHKLEGIGGGARFCQNFIAGCNKYFPDVKFEFDPNKSFDVLFVVTPTSISDDMMGYIEETYNLIKKQKKAGNKQAKKLIVRFDNLPKNSRNKRYRVWQKMIKLATWADEVIYQSNWAKNHIAWGEMPSKGTVIRNGVDKDIFNKVGKRRDFRNWADIEEVYLVLISSSDPCKRLHEALDIFSQRQRKYLEGQAGKCKLIIAGRLPDEYHVRLQEAGWDFVRKENVEYIGELNSAEEVAQVMRGCNVLVFPSYNDASPNTVLEARACGLDVISSSTGGTPELVTLPEYKMGVDYMCSEYLKIFGINDKKQWNY